MNKFIKVTTFDFISAPDLCKVVLAAETHFAILSDVYYEDNSVVIGVKAYYDTDYVKQMIKILKDNVLLLENLQWRVMITNAYSEMVVVKRTEEPEWKKRKVHTLGSVVQAVKRQFGTCYRIDDNMVWIHADEKPISLSTLFDCFNLEKKSSDYQYEF